MHVRNNHTDSKRKESLKKSKIHISTIYAYISAQIFTASVDGTLFSSTVTQNHKKEKTRPTSKTIIINVDHMQLK